jgi:hypothetical protein
MKGALARRQRRENEESSASEGVRFKTTDALSDQAT